MTRNKVLIKYNYLMNKEKLLMISLINKGNLIVKMIKKVKKVKKT